MKNNNVIFYLFVIANIFLLLVGAQHVSAEEIGRIDGLWVMKKVDERYEGDDVQEDMFLSLDRTTKAGGNPRHLDVRWLGKNYGKEDKLVIHFIAPEYAAGVTLSMGIKPYEDDDRWLYFPEVNIIRRVKAKDQHSNFMGTDFSYFDLSDREPDEENHKLLKIEKLNDRLCYVVETTPKEKVGNGYSKRITWVDKDRFTKMRIKYYDSAGKFKKQFDPQNWKQIDGIWTATRLVMEDFSFGHITIIERTNIRYNQNIPDDYFYPHSVDRVVYANGEFSLLPMDKRPTAVRMKQKKKSDRGRKDIPTPEEKVKSQIN